MPGKRISDLPAITGASTANDDNLVIFDTDANTTKRILRSQLAAGLVGDLPYTPAGFVSANTIPSAIAEIVSDVAGSSGASFVGYTQGSSGAAVATVQSKLREFVSVKDFGAEPSASASVNTTAIQAALATGKSLYFPTGSYNINANLFAQSNTVIDLNGSTLSGGGIRIANVTNVVVRNGKITGTGFGYAVEVTDRASIITLENLTATIVDSGFKISGEGSGAISYIKTNGLHVSQCKGSAYFHYNARAVMHENISTYNAMWGMNIVSDNDDIKVVNGYFELGAAATTPTGSDSWYSGTPEHGVYAHQSNNALFVNCTFKGWNRTNGACGIKWRNFANIKIIGGRVDSCSTKLGLFIQPGSVQNYLRQCVIQDVIFSNNLGDIFINDYVGTAGGSEEMDVVVRGCTFLANNANGNVNNQSPDTLSSLIFDSCQYYIGTYNFGAWYGSKSYKDCVFVTSPSFNLGFNATYFSTQTSVEGCTFVDWNTNGLVPATNEQQVLVAALRFENGSQKILVDSCVFMQPTKRRVGAYGTIAGQIGSIVISNCTGGGDVWASQSGGAVDCYISGCTSFSKSLNGTNIFRFTGTNVLLDNAGSSEMFGLTAQTFTDVTTTNLTVTDNTNYGSSPGSSPANYNSKLVFKADAASGFGSSTNIQPIAEIRSVYQDTSTGNSSVQGRGKFVFALSAGGAGYSAPTAAASLSRYEFAPANDNVLQLGTAALRWSEVFAAAPAINTSDAREKEQVRDLTAAERAVALRCKSLLRAFKFTAAAEQKGDGARIHFGVLAQEVRDAFSAEGLDAEKYALFCYDEWEDIYEDVTEPVVTVGEDGEEIVEHRLTGERRLLQAAGSRYGIRYEELLAFIIAAL